MKAIVFGGAGFLGSHVADALTDFGHEVVVFDLKHSSYLRNNQKMVIGDILDRKKVERAMNSCKIVYNFAGIADIDQAKKHPVETVKNNILGNTILLDIASKKKVKRFIFASSLYVYSKAGSFYRSSKQSAELIIENYSKMYGLNFTILRYGSLYGPRADKGNWMCQILKQALKEKKITRYGNGEEIREYIHVKDAARGSVEILDKKYENQCVIITGHHPMKVKNLLIMIKEIMGNRIRVEYKPISNKNYPYDAELHYQITPYSFSPQIAKKIVSQYYLDMGEGLLSYLEELYKEIANSSESTKKAKK
ncbi:NAD(P)-dependent oxidoreductase [bacterium]|nr:NAD(P)-dependent oxidoreductase [bacterium]